MSDREPTHDDVLAFMDDDERADWDSGKGTPEERNRILEDLKALWRSIPDPTDEELQPPYMPYDTWQTYQSGGNREGIRGFYVRQWKKQRKKDARWELERPKATPKSADAVPKQQPYEPPSSNLHWMQRNQNRSEQEQLKKRLKDLEDSSLSPEPPKNSIPDHPEISESGWGDPKPVDPKPKRPKAIEIPWIPTEKEREDAELLKFMPKPVRAAYDNADDEQKRILWEANKQVFEATKQRKEKEILAAQQRMAQVLDLLQRIKDDPSKAHLLPRDDSSIEELDKWFEKMSQPVSRPDYGNNPSESSPMREKFDGRFKDYVTPDELSDAQQSAEDSKQSQADPPKQPSPPADSGMHMPTRESFHRTPHSLGLHLQDSISPATDQIASVGAKPWYESRELVVGLVTTGIVTVMGIVLVIAPPTNPQTLGFWLLMILCVLCFSLGLIVHYFWRSWLAIAVGILVSVFFTSSFGWYVWPKPSPSPESEVVLIAPKESHAYKWIPLQRVAVEQGTLLPKNPGLPVFRLENLSDVVITGIRVTWRVLDPTPIKAVFLNSDHLKRYNPAIEPNGFSPFSLHNAKGEGTTVPASDEETIDIPYVPTAATSKDGVELSMPPSISNDYGLRLVATALRPNVSNQPSNGGGIMRTTGPTLEVILEYYGRGKDYKRRFRVDSSVLVISDTTGSGQFGENYIEPQFWSPDNLRATVTFKVSAAN